MTTTANGASGTGHEAASTRHPRPAWGTRVTLAFFAIAFLAEFAAPRSAHADEPMDAPESLFSLTGSPHPGFADDSELGLALTSGNTESSSLTFQERASYRWEQDTIALRGRYLESSASDIETAKNWLAGTRYERRLFHRTGMLVGESVEADTFAGYLQRYSTDFGVHRTLWDGHASKGDMEFGYRYQLENRPGDEARDVRQLARIFVESSYQWNPIVGSIVSFEYMPNLFNSDDWLMNADFSIKAAIRSFLALRTSYSLRFNNLPAAPGVKNLDTTLTTSFVATF